MALRPPALRNEQRFGAGYVRCERADAISWDLRDGRSPFGGFLDHVVAGAHDVVVVRFVLALGGFGHGLLVVSDAIGMQEVEVDLVVGNELVGDGADESSIGSRTDGDPFIESARARFVHARIYVDDTGAVLLNFRVVENDVAAAHAGFCRAVAEHDYEIRIQGLGHRGRVNVVVGAEFLAEHIRHDALYAAGGVVAVARDASAEHVEQSLMRRLDNGPRNARARCNEDGFVPIGVDDAFELARDGFDGLVPADLLEFIFAAFTGSLHGVREAIGGVDPAAPRTPAQACPHLGVFRISGIVGFEIEDLSVANVIPQGAIAAAIHKTLTPNDLVGLFYGRVPAALLLLLGWSRRSGSSGKREACQRTFDEGSAR